MKMKTSASNVKLNKFCTNLEKCVEAKLKLPHDDATKVFLQAANFKQTLGQVKCHG